MKQRIKNLEEIDIEKTDKLNKMEKFIRNIKKDFTIEKINKEFDKLFKNQKQQTNEEF